MSLGLNSRPVVRSIKRCGRSGGCRRQRLIARFGGHRLPDQRVELATCERRTTSVSVPRASAQRRRAEPSIVRSEIDHSPPASRAPARRRRAGSAGRGARSRSRSTAGPAGSSRSRADSLWRPSALASGTMPSPSSRAGKVAGRSLAGGGGDGEAADAFRQRHFATRRSPLRRGNDRALGSSPRRADCRTADR